MRTHLISYDGNDLAILHIDEERAAPVIREMVQFWSGWETRLALAEGNYLRVWLHQLARFILAEGRLPGNDDEGWLSMRNGEAATHGITVANWWPCSILDDDLIEIKGPVEDEP